MAKCMFRCPEGEEGREVIRHMNEHHAPLSDWALSHIDVPASDILDIGCGGGMLIGKLHSKYPDAKIRGIDISEESVRATVSNNPDVPGLDVRQVSVSDIPFPDGSFDLITAVETYFFWPDLENDLRSAVRCLKDGGVMAVVSEMYPHPDFDAKNAPYIREYGMNIIGNDELAGLMESAGLSTYYRVKEENNWVVFIGRKRSQESQVF